MNTYMESKANQIFITQETFRALMDSMARPGKINQLTENSFQPPQGLYPYSALISMTLLDTETSFAVLPDNQAWNEYIQSNTGAGISDAVNAEFIIADSLEDLSGLEEINRGSLLSPENGATILFQVNKIEEFPGSSRIRIGLQGPGINGVREIYISGMLAAHLKQLQVLNREYPLGVDFFLVATDGRVIGIPRSVNLEWEVIV